MASRGTIRVTRNSGLRAYWNQMWANPLTRQYSPGALLVTAAQSAGSGQGNSPSSTPAASPIYNPSGGSQVGDPRANGSGYFAISADTSGLAGLKGILGNTYIGGSSIGTVGNPVTNAISTSLSSGLIIPLVLIAFVLYLIFRK